MSLLRLARLTLPLACALAAVPNPTPAVAQTITDPFTGAPAEALPDLPPIPAPDGPVTFVIHSERRAQKLDGFGASDAWQINLVGRDWPVPLREDLARVLFSREFGPDGSPLGAGLSIWRFYVGAGSAAQGVASGIRPDIPGEYHTRTEGFLNPDGTYDWSRQAGQRWFLQAAKRHGVDHFVAFGVSPPVHLTRTGQANNNNEPRANLKDEHFDDYARFLAEVTKHFRDREGITFRELSPVNEPQWRWSGGRQEGSPWTNAEIARLTRLLDAELRARRLPTKIELSEAGDVRFVYQPGSNHASDQARAFFDRASPDYVGNLRSVSRTFAAHGYFSDGRPEEIITVRRELRAALDSRKLDYAMTEYCLLRDGVGKTTRERPIPHIDSALHLARLIHCDLVFARARSWQFWTALDLQKDPGGDLRYILVRRLMDRDGFEPTKLLWSLGHFSRFVRPGYVRIETTRADGLDEIVAAERELASAYLSPDGRELVVVVINWRPHAVPLRLTLANGRVLPVGRAYVTTADTNTNLRRAPDFTGGALVLAPRSIVTCVIPLR
jgi:O-glycosyl hydrolase